VFAAKTLLSLCTPPTKSRQLLIGVRYETLSVVAMCVRKPDRSPAGINR